MLHVHSKALGTIRKLAPAIAAIGAKDPDLARQLRRAASSIALNIAEAQTSRDGVSRQRFRTALGSTRETLSALQLAAAWGYVAEDIAAAELDEIAAMLYRLSR
jgi:four helix bundle protein